MKGRWLEKGEVLLGHLALAGAMYYIGVYAVIAVLRVAYPFELEWMEGLSVDAVARVLAGEPLYVRPTIEYVPAIYPPFYYWAGAAVAAVLGVGFLPLRLLSLASTVGAWLLIFSFVSRETKDRRLALIAVGLYAATFEWCGAWFEVARCDALFVVLLLAAFHLVRFRGGLAWHAAAAAVMALAVLTKQTGVSMAVALVLGAAALHGRRSALVVAGVLVALLVPTGLILDRASGGWFGFFVLTLPGEHDWRLDALREFWESDLGELAFALVLGLAFAAERALAARWRELLFYSFMTVSMLGAAWLSRLHGGGFRNVLMPAFATVAILFGLGLRAAPEFFAALDERRRRLVAAFLSVACVAQLGGLYWDPVRQVPTTRDREAGERMIARLELAARPRGVASIGEGVLVPWHGHYAALAGGGRHTLGMSLSDVFRSRQRRLSRRLEQELREALAAQRFAVVAVDNTSGFFGALFEGDLARCYERRGALFDDDDVFWPVTGFRTRPESYWVPRPGPGCGRPETE